MPAVPTALWLARRPKLLAMREAGKTLNEMAAHFGCTRGQVASQIHTMKRSGVIAEQVVSAEIAGNAEIQWTGAMDDTLRFMRQQRWSFEAVAGELRLATATVRKRARHLDMPMDLPPVEKLAPTKPKREAFWTTERHTELLESVKKGMSGPEIAKAMGATRGAVSGQISVLKGKGLISASDIKVANTRRAETRERVRAKQHASKPAPVVKVKIDKPQRAPVEHIVGYERIIASFEAPAGTGISIFDLGSSQTQCRWPFVCDDGETRYCGQISTDGSWCAAHGARVFASGARPSEPRIPGRSMFAEGLRT